MNPTINKLPKLLRLLPIVTALSILLVAARIGIAVQQKHTTGTLIITTNEPNATISITQANHIASLLSRNQARVRLVPGIYLVAATLGGNTSTASITIVKGQTTSKYINPAHVAHLLPSVNDVGFVNFDVLGDYGIGSNQLNNLELLFFDFKQSAKVVSVDGDSISSFSHGTAADNSDFTMTFSATVDSVSYNATVTYSGLDDIQLNLTNSSGQPIFAGTEPVEGDT